MNALRFNKHLDSNVLPELTPMIGKDVEIIVLETTAKPGNVNRPKAGSAKGKVTMAPDFDAPLDDFTEYMK